MAKSRQSSRALRIPLRSLFSPLRTPQGGIEKNPLRPRSYCRPSAGWLPSEFCRTQFQFLKWPGEMFSCVGAFMASSSNRRLACSTWISQRLIAGRNNSRRSAFASSALRSARDSGEPGVSHHTQMWVSSKTLDAASRNPRHAAPTRPVLPAGGRPANATAPTASSRRVPRTPKDSGARPLSRGG